MRQNWLLFSVLLLLLWIVPSNCHNNGIRPELQKTANFRIRMLLQENLCLPCPPGSYANRFKMPNCSSCADGWCPDNVTCAVCPPGSYTNQTNSTFCSICPSGTYTEYYNSTSCSECPAGSQPTDDHTMCRPCSPGYYSPHDGSICLPCEKGTYSPYHSTACFLCPAGTYNPWPAQGACTACGQGYYNQYPGVVSAAGCLICPARYYCPSDETTEPQECPADFYCVQGSAEPVACQALFESDEGSEDCRAEPYFYILTVIGSVLFLTCIVGLCYALKSGRDKHEHRKQMDMEAKRLIPPPKEGPVYGGL